MYIEQKRINKYIYLLQLKGRGLVTVFLASTLVSPVATQVLLT